MHSFLGVTMTVVWQIQERVREDLYLGEREGEEAMVRELLGRVREVGEEVVILLSLEEQRMVQVSR